MTKSRTAQLVYQSFYCAFGLIGIAGSIGLFDYKYNWDFYIYFTNISTFLCVFVMLAELLQTIRKKEDSYMTVLPVLKFICILGALLTFLVFNFMLAGAEGRDPALNFKVECILCHIVLPVMFTADWFLFYKRGEVRRSWPVLSSLFPLGYVGYVYIHAWIRNFDTSIMNYAGTDPVVYPYFFLNYEQLGLGGVIRWILILLAAFIAGGYLLMLLDRLSAPAARR